MAKTQTRPWDVTEHLHSDAEQVAYLEAAMEEDDPSFVAHALVNIARMRGILGSLEKALQRHKASAATQSER